MNDIVNNVLIEVEGIDKSGKDTLAPYITTITNYAYAVNIRGVLTQLVYNDKFNRNKTYNILYKPLIVFLDVDNNDHEIRCIVSKEPKININKDREAYYHYIKELEKYGFTILKFNTSKMTPMQIAAEVKHYLDNLDINDFILKSPISISSLNFYSLEDLKNEDIFYEYKYKEEV